ALRRRGAGARAGSRRSTSDRFALRAGSGLANAALGSALTRGAPLRAVVLCAGLGTRLRPFTEHWPKPALPVLGQPLFRYALALLRSAGVDAIGVNVHHLAERMEAVARAECERASMRVQISPEPIIQGTAGGIRGLRALLDEDDFVAMNGDVLF